MKYKKIIPAIFIDRPNRFLAFVIQMEGISQVLPNISTHPEFGQALEDAKAAGVDILFLQCKVKADSLEIKL